MDDAPIAVVREVEPLELHKGQIVDVTVGDTLTAVASGHSGATWSSRGGPDGFWVQPDGEVDFDFGPEDVGRYEVRVAWHEELPIPGLTAGRYVVELRVHPEGEAAAPLVYDEPLQRVTKRVQGQCELGLGATSAVTVVSGSQWERVGSPAVTHSAAPTLLTSCGMGKLLQPWVAAEVAFSPPGVLGPLGAGQLGVQRWFGPHVVGVYGELLLVRTDDSGAPVGSSGGLGARWHAVVAHHTGPDVRLAARGDGFRATLGWTWTP